MPAKETVLRHAPFALLTLMTYYFLPLLETTDSGRLLLLLAYTPGLIFAIAWFFGLFNRFRWYAFLAAGLLFLPAALLFYNSSALLFSLVYAALFCAGNFFGGLWSRGKKPSAGK